MNSHADDLDSDLQEENLAAMSIEGPLMLKVFLMFMSPNNLEASLASLKGGTSCLLERLTSHKNPKMI